jgi:hypothetical protein
MGTMKKKTYIPIHIKYPKKHFTGEITLRTVKVGEKNISKGDLVKMDKDGKARKA